MIRLLVLDVDGVLTDGGLYYGPDGETVKRFDVRDGLGIKLLQQAGVTVAMISGRDCPALRRRASELGVSEVHAGVGDKRAVLDALLIRVGVDPGEAAAMGDDLPDLAMFEGVGLRLAPADAAPEVLAAADHFTPRAGGRGAVRDAATFILARNGAASVARRETTSHG